MQTRSGGTREWGPQVDLATVYRTTCATETSIPNSRSEEFVGHADDTAGRLRSWGQWPYLSTVAFLLKLRPFACSCVQ